MTVINSWTNALAEIEHRIGSRFARSQARVRALAYVRELLSLAERKNSWRLAEMLGDPTPYETPSANTCWVVRIGVRMPFVMICNTPRRVIDHLNDSEAILVVDETGFLKKAAIRSAWRVTPSAQWHRRPR